MCFSGLQKRKKVRTVLSREFIASMAFVERYVNLIKRYVAWEAVFVVYSIVNTLTIALIGVRGGPQAGAVSACRGSTLGIPLSAIS